MRYQSQRIAQIPPYMFAEFNKKKRMMQEAGIDVIDLGIGDPDLPTPQHIIDKLVEETADPQNLKYPSFIGCTDFRKAVAAFYQRQFHVELDPETEVLALIGSKEGLAHLVPTVIDPGETVLAPDPGYPPYRMAISLAGGQLYPMPLLEKNNFEPEFQNIPENTAAKAKLMFLNYPGNPTAATVDVDFFRKAVSFAKQHKIVIAHDAAYNMVTFDGYQAPSILQAEGAKEVAVEFGSLSKTYSMTGWRIGYAVGNKEVLRALSTYKSNTDTGQFTPIQKAAAHALTASQESIKTSNEIYAERMKAMTEALKTIGVKTGRTRGTFFIWAPVPDGYTSAEFADRVLEKTGVIITPGHAFGAAGEGYFRLSLSVPTARLTEAINRMKKELTIMTN
ncbi:LL-diaminopimelate aminotransferase [Pseudobacillus badius]|uniref:LL-diaminopimelate aminotransferase n=1 Tax=Bacillus badius TaxID=1455 RepID=UPI0007B0AC05|nr:LL-diaminopimelate aminotransferase [Bacillus badius]KZN98540.1 LL-diaminopimelate aminotransferase [Bacillus badius]MED0666200.1 LL-diaminopimelate aminotransferase [Bacillus badius]OCS83237.1 LL-diaminopimelate aminotransferase [Bacillus badius]OVE51613.1 LL-diaminopimelate aminotransferase [Bacillus badius]TDW02858.1 LL-diaminopimelate aminotransferase [Bacillus badius]